MKIFSMNDCDTVAAESKEEAIVYYTELTGLDGVGDVLDDIVEEDPKLTTMWYGMKLEELKLFLEKHCDKTFPIKADPRGENDFVLSLTYALVLELDEPTKPYIIASTEY